MIEITINGSCAEVNIHAFASETNALISGQDGIQKVCLLVEPAQAQQIFDTFGKWLGCGDEGKDRQIEALEAEVQLLREQAK